MKIESIRHESFIMMVIALLPILNLYKAFSSFIFADMAVILIFGYLIVCHKKLGISKNCRSLVYVAAAIIITWFLDTTIIQIGYNVNVNLANSFFSAVRVVLYYMFVAIIATFMNLDFFLRIYRIMLWLCTEVLIIQTLVYAVTGRVLLGYFTFFHLLTNRTKNYA